LKKEVVEELNKNEVKKEKKPILINAIKKVMLMK